MKDIPKKQIIHWFLIILLCVGNMHIAFAQGQKKITGRVMDAQGELLIGVNVTEAEKPSAGVITDMNGTYTITLNPGTTALKFTYIGFKDKIVKIGSKGIVDVSMEEDAVSYTHLTLPTT